MVWPVSVIPLHVHHVRDNNTLLHGFTCAQAPQGTESHARFKMRLNPHCARPGGHTLTSHILPSLSTRVMVPQQSEYQSCPTPEMVSQQSKYVFQCIAFTAFHMTTSTCAHARTHVHDFAQPIHADANVEYHAIACTFANYVQPVIHGTVQRKSGNMRERRGERKMYRISLLAPCAPFLREHHPVARLCQNVLSNV